MKLSQEIKQKIEEILGSEEFKITLYEGLEERKRIELGQFYTPATICIQMIERFKWDNLSGKNILDPTCGSGNLLIACLIAGADSDKLFGNEYDEIAVELCKKRLNRACEILGKPLINDWQIHQGNALISDCLTEFGPDYNNTILSILLSQHRDNKNSDRDNHITYTLLDRPDEEQYLREKQSMVEKALAPDVSKLF
jgi:hypothetical protein